MPWRIVASLLRSASHSLVSLTLTGSPMGSTVHDFDCIQNHTSFIGSLRGFAVLATIRIDVLMLTDIAIKDLRRQHVTRLESDETDSESGDEEIPSTWYLDVAEERNVVHQLINVLPASAESLTLEMLASRTLLQQLLSRLPDRKTERLPKLRQIYYECDEHCVIGVEDECLAAGVEIVQVLKYGDTKNWRRDSLESEESNNEFVNDDDWYYDNDYPYCEYEENFDQYLIKKAEEEAEDQVYMDEQLEQVYGDINDFESRIASHLEQLEDDQEEETYLREIAERQHTVHLAEVEEPCRDG